MTTRRLGSTAFRIIAIYLFVRVLASLPSVFGFLSMVDQVDLISSKVDFLLSSVLPTVILLICAIGLFVGSDFLTRRLFVADEAIEPIDRRDAEAIAFAVAGIWIFGLSIPALAQSAFSMVSPLNRIGDYAPVDLPWKSALASGAQAILGLVLFLGAGPISRWWSSRVTRGARETRP